MKTLFAALILCTLWMPAMASTVDTQAPHLEIISAGYSNHRNDVNEEGYPTDVWATDFKQITAWVGDCPDLEYVEFVFRPEGADEWRLMDGDLSWDLIDADLYSPDGSTWYLGNWDLRTLSAGWYEAAAVGVDMSGNVDQWPPVMRFYAESPSADWRSVQDLRQVRLVTAVPSVTTGPTEFRLAQAVGMDNTLNIFDVQGRRVVRLPLDVGATRVNWNGRTTNGEQIPAGIYFVGLNNAPSQTTRIIVTH